MEYLDHDEHVIEAPEHVGAYRPWSALELETAGDQGRVVQAEHQADGPARDLGADVVQIRGKIAQTPQIA